MKLKIIFFICFLLCLVFTQAQTKGTNNNENSTLAKSNADSVTSNTIIKPVKNYIGTIASAMITENTFTHPAIKFLCNGKSYVLEIEKETEFINMGIDGTGKFNFCPFFMGTYKISGVITNQSILAKKIECVKNEGKYLKIIFQDGMFMRDTR